MLVLIPIANTGIRANNRLGGQRAGTTGALDGIGIVMVYPFFGAPDVEAIMIVLAAGAPGQPNSVALAGRLEMGDLDSGGGQQRHEEQQGASQEEQPEPAGTTLGNHRAISLLY
jgi:hypothetical protein